MKKSATSILAAALALPIVALAAQGPVHGSNYSRCVAQKTAAAHYYCTHASKSCTAEVKAAAKQCRVEVKKGLRF